MIHILSLRFESNLLKSEYESLEYESFYLYLMILIRVGPGILGALCKL